MRVLSLMFPLVCVALAGCLPQSPDVYVDKSWVRLAALPEQPAAAYFRLTGGQKDDALFTVTSPVAIKAEMHDTMSGAGGMSQMIPIDSVAVPARAKVMFAPGGKHVMLTGLPASIKAGQSITINFVFRSGLELQDTAIVVGAGDPAPKL